MASFSDILCSNGNDIKIIDVGLRDGFQHIKKFIPTDVKISIGKLLIDAGITEMEVTSFVSPKWVPQMSDATEVVEALSIYRKQTKKSVILKGLTPNLKGVQIGQQTGVDVFTVPISVSERHNKENTNKSIDESFLELKQR